MQQLSRRFSTQQKRFLVLLLIITVLILMFVPPAFSETVIPIVFPVDGECSFTDTFGAPRGGGTRTHEGIDIMAPKMTPVLAAVDGRIGWLNDGTATSTANGLPYYNLMLFGDDGNDYFYVHLNNDTPGTDDGQGGPVYAYAPGIANGVRVLAGQHIAYVGDSGNAEDTAPHLHFEIHLGGYKNPINSYPSLVAARNVSLFKDIASGTWYFQHVNALVGKGIVNGYDNGTFKPDNPVSRAEFIKMVAIASGIEVSTEHNNYFPDVPFEHWSRPYIEAAKSAGIVSGDTRGRFRPDEPINRAEAAKIIVKASGLAEGSSGDPFIDVSDDFWGYISIMTARSSGIISGYPDGTYRPLNPINRAESSKIIHAICM